MLWIQKELTLRPVPRGFHLITQPIVEALPELAYVEVGLLHLFIQHTSASLSVNENADPDVRRDLEALMSHLAPEDFPYRHTAEGPDDMPAHAKASLLGASITLPIGQGRLRLGTWQGIYLCEHRDEPSARTVILTVSGKRK